MLIFRNHKYVGLGQQGRWQLLVGLSERHIDVLVNCISKQAHI